MAPEPYQLVMKAGPAPGKTFALDRDEIHIGRDVNNDIVVNDAEISRRHARFTMRTGGYVLEDLGSTNGTFVNAQRVIGPRQLQPGDTITFGENVSFTFESSAPAQDAGVIGARPEKPPPPQVADYPPGEPSQPPAPEPVFSGYVPPSPEEPIPAPQARRRTNTRVWATCGCLAVLACAAASASLWYIDTNNLWCGLFPFLAGCP